MISLCVSSPEVSVMNSLPLDTHTHQGTLGRHRHLPLLNSSPPILYFSLRLCNELCSIQPGLRNHWRSFSFIYCWQSTATNW
ncbi:unnamed protein product [Hymenolepis diminuta]|uniref:Uncharacterized protein n=1 Tax=Hymenolepis diminuta TaxID=6216 RepID=A0A564Z832_HYMDI|nr:unnamed protein product [Hymenolepis diminuta]